MKVKYVGNSYPVSLITNKVYDVLAVENGWFKLLDENEEEYLFPPTEFEVVKMTN